MSIFETWHFLLVLVLSVTNGWCGISDDYSTLCWAALLAALPCHVLRVSSAPVAPTIAFYLSSSLCLKVFMLLFPLPSSGFILQFASTAWYPPPPHPGFLFQVCWPGPFFHSIYLTFESSNLHNYLNNLLYFLIECKPPACRDQWAWHVKC